MSGITKEIRSFLFYSRVQLILFKDNANEWNNKRNTKFSFGDSRMQLIFVKCYKKDSEKSIT